MIEFSHVVFLTWEQVTPDENRMTPGMWADVQFGPKYVGWSVDENVSAYQDARGITYTFTQAEHAFAFKMRFG